MKENKKFAEHAATVSAGFFFVGVLSGETSVLLAFWCGIAGMIALVFALAAGL